MIPPISSTPFAPIAPIEPGASPSSSVSRSPVSAGETFQAVLNNAIQTVERSHESAAGEVNAVLEGRRGELHSAILAVQRSELQFQFFLQLRNKVVNAYQEVMRVQL